ncbi:hypothetical protein [Propionivibrio dicarboxylicus]|nr:hypothetical protein [Propionivibrio dicarboxylicus]
MPFAPGYVYRDDGRVYKIDGENAGKVYSSRQVPITHEQYLAIESFATSVVLRDTNGDGIVEQRERTVKDADGGKTVDLRTLNADGSLAREAWTTTSADGVAIDVLRDTNGDGIVEQRERTVKDADGGKTVDLRTLNADGSLARETWTTTSADGLTVDVRRDTNGDGIVEQREHTVKDTDGGKTVDLQTLNADGSLARETWTMTNADGTNILTERDSNGDGTIEQEEFVVRDDQGVQVSIENYDAAGMLTSASTKTTSADGLTLLTERDTNGDGAVEQSTQAVTAADGGKSNDVRNFSADGSLKSEVLTTTAADGAQTSRYALAASGAQTLEGGGHRLAVGTSGNNALAGNDAVTLIIGGAGNDTMTLGSGTNVLAFDVGDGKDTVRASAGEHNVLSLGGALTPDALSFSKSGDALVLGVGENDAISFRDWYASPANRCLKTLQLIVDDQLGVPENLRTCTVETFDFNALADRFDQARAADPAVRAWQLSNTLFDACMGTGKTTALGGDLAYQYALRGTLSGMDIAAATAVLADPQFGRSAQTVSSWGAISGGTAPLR